MKTRSKALLKFAIVAVLLTIIFRLALSNSLAHHQFFLTIIATISYGLLMYATGKYYGKQNRKQLPIYDLGFRFHLTTFLVYNLISYTWFILKLNSALESITPVIYTSIVWGIMVLFHGYYYLRAKKNTIKQLHKDDLFE